VCARLSVFTLSVRPYINPSIPQATASESLSLEDERTAQRSWRADPRKATWILHHPDAPSRSAVCARLRAGMVGDVNLYLDEGTEDEEEEGVDTEGTSPSRPLRAEVEVMVAVPTLRRRGLAAAAVRAAVGWAATSLGVTRFVAKILESNEASLALFRGPSLGFVEYRRVACFGELHLALPSAGVDAFAAAWVAGRRKGGGVEVERVSWAHSDSDPEDPDASL